MLRFWRQLNCTLILSFSVYNWMNNSNEIICTAFHRFLKLKFQIAKRLKNCNGTEYIPSEKFDDYHVNYYETTISTLPVYDFTRARVNVIEDYCNITIPISLENLQWRLFRILQQHGGQRVNEVRHG